MTTCEDIIVWTDTETSGISPANNHLLEIACIVTDTGFNVLDESGFEATIRYAPADVFAIRDAADDFVKDMHDKSGLWGRLPSGTNVGQVDQDLVEYIRQFAPAPRQGRFAGNSLRLDMNFIDAFLPATAAHMHYRSIDVSSLAYVAQIKFGVPYFEKELRHEARADILESLAEMRHVLQALNSR